MSTEEEELEGEEALGRGGNPASLANAGMPAFAAAPFSVIL